MTCASPSVAITQPAAAYEALRAAILSGRSNGQRGLAILVHRGLAAWIGEMKPEAPPLTPLTTIHNQPTHPAAVTPKPNELTRVLAGIILALTTGSAHART
jgi:hypothetical protein